MYKIRLWAILTSIKCPKTPLESIDGDIDAKKNGYKFFLNRIHILNFRLVNAEYPTSRGQTRGSPRTDRVTIHGRIFVQNHPLCFLLLV